MDEFVRTTLTNWGLADHIQTFKDHKVNESSFMILSDSDVDELFPAVGPRATFRDKYRKFKENPGSRSSTSTQSPQAAATSQTRPSTSNTPQKGKRKRRTNHQAELSHGSSPARRQRCDTQSENILNEVKEIMAQVEAKLGNDTNFNKFLIKKIKDLDTDKKKLVGVFGKTGAGKSSLINAIIGEKDLLPSGAIRACTAVMIKVEANMDGPEYEAEIEFITEEEWKDDLWVMYDLFKENGDQGDKEKDHCYRDLKTKMSAVYGEHWETKSPIELMKKHLYKDILDCLKSRRKIFKHGSALELCKNIMKFTRTAIRKGPGEEERRYWPLVKCVTIRVPNADLLQHVTLVDLPGNGDRNKSRDQMWKELVGDCSTVWIVAEVSRPADEREAWEILESACGLMGPGGECQQIHFICTKSDHLKDSNECSVAETRENIREEIKKEFKELPNLNKHFSGDCFKVFIVSSDQFLSETQPKSDDNEIPELQRILLNLNDHHSRTSNYVSGAHGILSLIQGANSGTGAASKAAVCRELEENLQHELDKISNSIEAVYETFEPLLQEGVEKSKDSCERDLELFLNPTDDGRGFHKILKALVKNNGIYQPKKSSEMNLNMTLASHLMKSIDEEFFKTFSNKGKCEYFNGAINNFSLGTEILIKTFKDVELQLTFLKSEEDKMKKKLNDTIRDRKKTIYRSLAEAIKENMTDCYKKAAKCKKTGSLERMRNILKDQMHDSKEVIFEAAKEKMLNKLRDLKEEILKELEQTLKESVELSLKVDYESIPDFPTELQRVKELLPAEEQ